ncbi:hypothetical protein IQ260_10070 [Leptolyngbya cf. ectocarpi LEGE 11479]|uniref:Uncharacterized protein n=1 Tax=Leptolyngbya cf. ectocarpi LEGE 11479 TaxID=1828722 RepID=A0A928ZTC3_LEPEC|nr:hypothetical protein [Leptolyngbya ectocarpi]MBE9067001.1 hypothetical protein [Leptolyngbya cf. ectocarpi LEGE 11479]
MSDVSEPNGEQPDELEILKHKMNLELEAISVNQLHTLATLAVEKKLITAHGYRGGQYELLRDGEFVLLSPTEAIQYLQDLVNDGDQP